jgi:hypothetical protein
MYQVSKLTALEVALSFVRDTRVFCIFLQREPLFSGTPGFLGCFSERRRRRSVTDRLTKREQPDRSKINIHEAFEAKYWTHALGVTQDVLKKAIDKVGNSAAAVRKELASRGDDAE